MLKKFFYKVFVNNRVIDTLSSTFLSTIIPPVVGLYYGTLDIWGDDWDIVKNYKEIHETIFAILATATILLLFIKGISDGCKGAVTKRYRILSDSLIFFSNDLVKKKKDRYHHAARTLTPKGDTFKNIVQPKDQLTHALDSVRKLLIEGFDINTKNIGITIIQGNPNDDRWWYMLKCNSQKQHTKPKDLMNSASTAKYCYESGDSIFIPDMRKGLKEGAFLDSDRSKKVQKGSIFCKPVRVNVGNVDYVYIFTIAIYGQFLCIPYDEDECIACEKILDEIADRIELELYLYSMKQFKELGGKAA
ncbi:hypothetical protein Q6U62_004604 [Vibrio parahaemolyticus]|uniref:hypothetical protein n=1 Tax=Vibrio parahaemolyticus TaxID=670 RepID=UPI00194003B7|nr:hypothetical protein [Vibrio parahaemolyticus]HAS8314476.1 hypothetical protein [Vibrio vulnificus]HBC3492654.1 hypothetical protein [Vibrio alginolyticus]EJC1078519.1 hypothetical protein [Vibrio parahaemolyticus]EJK2183542.1 hypothetical protein [Vibrio parahaemolyticus]ELA7772608.1 hypothetical protein [Vibrio parahaemolyticus]